MFQSPSRVGCIGDLRMMRSGPLRGAARLARHLWRMTFALFIAALSFFIGQARVIPEPIRIMPLLALPVLAVLVTMVYWLWRIRVRRTTRGTVTGALMAAAAGGPWAAVNTPAGVLTAYLVFTSVAAETGSAGS